MHGAPTLFGSVETDNFVLKERSPLADSEVPQLWVAWLRDEASGIHSLDCAQLDSNAAAAELSAAECQLVSCQHYRFDQPVAAPDDQSLALEVTTPVAAMPNPQLFKPSELRGHLCRQLGLNLAVAMVFAIALAAIGWLLVDKLLIVGAAAYAAGQLVCHHMARWSISAMFYSRS